MYSDCALVIHVSSYFLCSKRIFVLGPSHHYYLTRCAISMATQCNTPLYPLQVDTESKFEKTLLEMIIKTIDVVYISITVNNELLKTGKFEKMSRSVDEDEHSIEMHLPYIAQVMSRLVISSHTCH